MSLKKIVPVEVDSKIDVHELAEVIVTILDARDSDTFDHSWRVAALCEEIAARMGVPPKWQDTIHIAAHLHDIGKVGVPDYVLHKKGRLTPKEFLLVQSHSEIGYNIIHRLPVLNEISLYILHHHERWDGNGYPSRVSCRDIPLGARIIAVADTFDAITTMRPYRTAGSFAEAFCEIKRVAGSQLCPEVAEVFLSMRDSIPGILEKVRKEIRMKTSHNNTAFNSILPQPDGTILPSRS